MRKLLVPLAAVAVASLVAAATAIGAASKTVTISKTGYTPTAVSITTGDAVVFKNADTVAHTVDLSPTTGTNCSAAVAIAAGQSASCTFSSAGKFKFSDAASNKKAFRGTITVTLPLVSSLNAAPKAVVYGGKATLSGKLASGQSGQSVQIHAQACGETKSTLVATVTTTAGGAFSYQAQPSKKTAYTLSNKGLTANIGVDVAPSLHLSKAGKHRFSMSVTAAQSFAGKVATFQRFNAKLKRWVKVKSVVLKTGALAAPPTLFTVAKFRSSIKPHVRVRVSLAPKQAAPCYLAGHSNTIHS